MKTSRRAILGALLLGAASFSFAMPTQAKDLKIGVIVPFTGPFSPTGDQARRGIELFIQQHGDVVAGRKVVTIYRDDAGKPDTAKRQASELLIKDGVDILAGFTLTPSAFSVAPLATQAKVPMVIMNAATSSATELSPYIVRTSMAIPQSAWAMAKWAHDNGMQRVFTLVSDYGPGHDAESQFSKTFKAEGGEIVGAIRAPLTTSDYSPFLERVKSEKPDALFLFTPNGQPGVVLMRNLHERGLLKAGIKLIGDGSLVDEDTLDAIGDTALGMVTAFHYSEAHDSKENHDYVAASYKLFPKTRPNVIQVGAYDGMQLIYNVLNQTHGDAGAEAFVAAAKGMKWESPRGPMEIDPQTRDVIQNEYIREVKRVDGHLQNVEFDVIPNVKDPGKAEK